METVKIMIVEDEAILALELKATLTQRGFTITSIASSGKQAILNADKDHPDLILMDISLKGKMDGIEAASIIRESADIPIIFLTAFAEQEMLEKAKPVMPFGYIIKPYQERDLRITIEMALYRARADRERKKIEKALIKANDDLELNVEQRTRELIDTNLELRNEIESRKIAEDELRKSELRFKTIFENANDGMLLADPETRFIDSNKRMGEMLGYSKNELENLSIADIHLEKDLPYVLEQFEKMATGKIAIARDLPVKTKKGKIIYADISSSPIEIEGQTYILGTFRDVSDFKILQARLQQSQKMEAIGTLAGGIAHDFNNILVPILGYTEMLLGNSPEGSALGNDLNQIFNGALRAKDLVQQILTFSRKENYKLKPMKIQPIVKEALKLIRSTIPTTIDIKQNIQTECGPVKANPTQIHQIIMNLTTNAYHAMQDTGGELEIKLGEMKLDKSKINPELKPGLYACLTIADQGMGMDKELIAKIFDPFFTTKEKSKGTGMGLSVVHGIVKSMDGNIQVHSEPDKGTKFHVYLPIINESEQQSQTKEPIVYGTETLLLVDDEEVIITMQKKMLERLGYRVISLNSSIDALQAFRTDPNIFDLVITDMAMPDLSGDKLAVELIKIRPGIPILLCTGFSDDMSEQKATSLGIKDLLMKPVRMNTIAKKIREILDKTKNNSHT
jgi:PAS domain S-box-containing protein